MRRLVEEHELDPTAIEGTGKDGRLTKKDVLAHLEARYPRPNPRNCHLNLLNHHLYPNPLRRLSLNPLLRPNPLNRLLRPPVPASLAASQ